MQTRALLIIVLTALALLQTGCRTMSAKGRAATESKWKTFGEAKADFDQIKPAVTMTEDLVYLGFHPCGNQNVRVLTYLDVMHQFLPNSSVKMEDLPPAVREFLSAQKNTCAYEVEIIEEKSKRYGNLLLDVLSFDRKTCYMGWRFKALVLVKDDTVVYTLWSGQPKTERHERKTRPLGPVQELEGLLGRFVR